MDRGRTGKELRRARVDAGLTQREVAERCGLSQPNIAAYEAGDRPMSDEMLDRLFAAMRPRPSDVLREHARDVRKIAQRHGAVTVKVFGSVARGEDHYDSDVDLLVTVRPGTSLFGLVRMTRELQDLLGTKVDIVSEGGLYPDDDQIRDEAVLLW